VKPPLPPREYANAAWTQEPMPRPPMPAEAAIAFALDWPAWSFLPARCNLCGVKVKGAEAGAFDHLDKQHPTWLDEWNAVLRQKGVVR
jgi:hypothetical protein